MIASYEQLLNVQVMLTSALRDKLTRGVLEPVRRSLLEVALKMSRDVQTWQVY